MPLNHPLVPLERVAFIGTAPPRQCGIATFIASLAEAIAARYWRVKPINVAITDTDEGYAYAENVAYEIPEHRRSSYGRAAHFLNMAPVDVASVQHEFGIFGGPAGGYIVDLLHDLRMPIVTTVHTVLADPNPDQQLVMSEIIRCSDRLVAISEHARNLLIETYGATPARIDLIPHGIPDMPFVDSSFHKDTIGVEGSQVMLTFGLIGPSKGIEHAIRAMPRIVARHPNVVYIVLGATHPTILRREGESYRDGLQKLATKLGVSRQVIFVNRFVSADELKQYLGAADIYVTPYTSKAQVSSGTLAYAVGAGKAVVSTPYWHAEELLSESRGVLTPSGDSDQLADAVISLLDNPVERDAMRKRAYLFARNMIWSNVAGQYMRSFLRARHEQARQPRPLAARVHVDRRRPSLPVVQLQHLSAMTDSVGLLQHAVFCVPNREHGYCLDDNARALLLMSALASDQSLPAEHVRMSMCYMAYVNDAYHDERGRFRNFRSFDDGHWQEDAGSEDSHGRAMWALGTLAGDWPHASPSDWAAQLFQRALYATRHFTSPRAWAFTLLGLHRYLARFDGDRAAMEFRATLAQRLIDLHRQSSGEAWPWFENTVTYDNARLPQALIVTGADIGDADMLQIGVQSLEWLAELQRADQGHFVPIGNYGFYRRGGRRARFDQQPVEAHAMVEACLDAWRRTADPTWLGEARRAFLWFMGDNDLRLPLVDVRTGGCHDGLQPDRVNQNQGAESTLAYLLALTHMRAALAETAEAAADQDSRLGAA